MSDQRKKPTPRASEGSPRPLSGGAPQRDSTSRPRRTSSARRNTDARGSSRQTRPHAGSAQTRRPSGDAPARSSRQRRPETAHRSSTQNRNREARAAAARKRRNLNAALGIAVIVCSLLLVVFAVRGIAGCVSGALSSREPGRSLTEEMVADQTETTVSAFAAADPVQIDLVMIGDILQHRGVFESGFLSDGTRNYDHVFAHIGSELEGADIKVVNQETILGGESLGFSGYPSFNGPQEMGDAEAKVGFNVILRATNHALDYGYEGLHNELSFWATTYPDQVAVIGAADTYDGSTSADDVYVFEKDGFKVALVNYTYDLNGYEDPQGAVSMLEEDHVRSTMAKADEEADMVVVFPHWGEEYNLEPVESQYEWAQLLMDCGADVIIGGHPHVIEPVEVLTASDGHKVPCFWSVGNFISTQVDNENLVGGLAKVSLVKDSDGSCRVTGCSFVPTITHKGSGADMTTYLLRDFNNDLAATSYCESNGTENSSLTVEWANDFCTQVLGSAFDTASEQLTLGETAFKADAVAEETAAEEPEDLDAAA